MSTATATAAASDEVGQPYVLSASGQGWPDGMHWLDDNRLLTTSNSGLELWSSAGVSAYAPSVDPYTNPAQIAFSPDGTKVAYFDGQLRLANPDGSNVQTPQPGLWISNCCIVWSDDSSTIFFQDSYGAIDSLNVATLAMTQLTSRGTWRTVIDQRNGVLIENDFSGPSWEIFEQPATGGQAVDLGRQGYQERFSPDGKLFVYTGYTDGRIHVAEMDGSADVAVTPAGMPASSPTWRPDGGMIAFSDYAGSPGGTIYTVRPDGSDLRQIYTLPADQTFAAARWSPTSARFAFSAIDASGHSFVYMAPPFVLPDTTPPIVTGTPDRAPNTAGWYNAPVTITWTATDPSPSSGAPTVPAPSVVSSEGANQTITSMSSCDPAGNCATGSLTLSIDTTPPLVTLTGPIAGATYTVGSAPSPNCSTSDSLSGTLSQATLTVIGMNSDGSGSITASCSGAQDVAGNTAGPISVTYNVRYAVTGGGFSGSVNSPPTLNTGKAGRNYQFAFQLTSAGGTVVTDTSVVSSLTYQTASCATFAGDPTDALVANSTGNTQLRFDTGSQQFLYNWKTPAMAGCYVFFVTLRDGNVLTANFNLK